MDLLDRQNQSHMRARTHPLPLSVRLSMMSPSMAPVGSALSSNTSANVTVASARASRLSPWKHHPFNLTCSGTNECYQNSGPRSRFLYLESGDVDRLNVSSKLLTDDVVGEQLPFDSLRVGLSFIALVHRHDDRN